MWRWLWIVLIIGALKTILGIVGYSATLLGVVDLPPGITFAGFQAATAFSFGLVGAALLIAGFKDRRALHLGSAFILIASSNSDVFFIGLASLEVPVLQSVVKLLFRLQPDSFFPVFLWLFFAEFPLRSGFGFASTLPGRAARFCSIVGTALFCLVAFETKIPFPGQVTPLSTLPRHNLSLHVLALAILLSLSLPAFLFAIWNARKALTTERRRVRLFLTGMGLGLIPSLFAMVLETSIPAFARLIRDPSGRMVESLILRPLLILVPVITAYSVLVDHILDVRLYLRRAVQYALTRYALLAATIVPFIVLVAYIYFNRARSVAELLAGSHMILALIVALSLLGLMVRSRVSRFVDRHFFREQYDARQILSQFVSKSREIESAEEMVSMLSGEIKEALHLETAAILYRAGATGELITHNGAVRPFRLSWPLAKLVAGSADPLDTDLTSQEATLRRLSKEEREWIAEGGFSLLVPLIASNGSLVGLMALGDKKSELPFSSEDRVLLEAIASAVSLTLENRVLRSTPNVSLYKTGSDSQGEKEFISFPSFVGAAVECGICHRLHPDTESICSNCGGSVAPAKVPLILRGKFRFERRLALGGMSAVYEATDMDLQRRVAVKTLPRTSPELSIRLRREARAVAAVSHPNLASIFGVEMWQGMPMLVLEYLNGGTLAHRLKEGGLEIGESLKLGISLCGALDRLHGAGILHRDLKPSNIGYTSDRIPKILDLGLAKIVNRIESEQAISNPNLGTSDMPTPAFTSNPSITIDGSILGTLAYLSPEALRAAPPEPRFDLWSLSVVILQSITAVNPFAADSGHKTVENIRNTTAESIKVFTRGMPDVLVSLFIDLLAPDPGHRPASAMEMSIRLKKTLGIINERSILQDGGFGNR